MRRHAIVDLGADGDAQPEEPEEPEPQIGTIPTAVVADSATMRTHEPSPPDRARANQQRCADGDLSGCHAAALDAYYQPSSPDNDAAALAAFRKGCDGGYAPSCNGLGTLHAQGRGASADKGVAAGYYRQACMGGSSTGCVHLANALRTGDGIPKDEAAANQAEARYQCLTHKPRAAPPNSCPTL